MSHPPRAAAYAQRIVPEPPAPQPPGEESREVWGSQTAAFACEAGQVEFRRARYAISGKVIPNLLPWAETILGLPLDPKQRRASGYPTALPERFGNELSSARSRRGCQRSASRRIRGACGRYVSLTRTRQTSKSSIRDPSSSRESP